MKKAIQLEWLKLHSSWSFLFFALLIFSAGQLFFHLDAQIMLPGYYTIKSGTLITDKVIIKALESIYQLLIIAVGCDIGREFTNKVIQRNRVDGLTPGQFLVSKLFRSFVTYGCMLLIFLTALYLAGMNLGFQPDWGRAWYAALLMILSFLYVGSLVILLALLLQKTALILVVGFSLRVIEYILIKWAGIPVPFLPVTLSETIFPAPGGAGFPVRR
ncbi:MAG: hypothetical protein LRY55_10625 [Leadbetterella sp.]|nr:hypothetical protein [Leadbetterella sp.]